MAETPDLTASTSLAEQALELAHNPLQLRQFVGLEEEARCATQASVELRRRSATPGRSARWQARSRCDCRRACRLAHHLTRPPSSPAPDISASGPDRPRKSVARGLSPRPPWPGTPKNAAPGTTRTAPTGSAYASRICWWCARRRRLVISTLGRCGLRQIVRPFLFLRPAGTETRRTHLKVSLSEDVPFHDILVRRMALFISLL